VLVFARGAAADAARAGSCLIPHSDARNIFHAAMLLGLHRRIELDARALEFHTPAAGADFVGSDDLVAKIQVKPRLFRERHDLAPLTFSVQGGWVEFERCLATPDVMPIIRCPDCTSAFFVDRAIGLSFSWRLPLILAQQGGAHAGSKGLDAQSEDRVGSRCRLQAFHRALPHGASFAAR
jgi:hypothetical protein